MVTRALSPGWRSAAILSALAALAGASAVACANRSSGDDRSRPVASAAPQGPSSARLNSALATTNTIRRDSFGCLLTTPGTTSSAFEVDCPSNMLRPGEAAPVARRPAGKEDWVRVRPWIYFDPAKKECAYTGEWFCAPPGKFGQCTAAPKPLPVSCKQDAAGGTLELSSFVYTDANGACHKVAATSCKTNRRGLCDLPEGEIVPCAAK